MANISGLNQYNRTDNADVIAGDVASEKIAYTNSGKITGTYRQPIFGTYYNNEREYDSSVALTSSSVMSGCIAFTLDKGTAGPWHGLYIGAGDEFILGTENSDYFRVYGENGSGTLTVSMRSATTVRDGVWHTVLWSFDAVNTLSHMYLDGVSSKVTSTLTNNGPINVNAQQFTIGSSTNGSNAWEGNFAWIGIDDQYIDFSVQANRDKFIYSDGNPRWIGDDGSLGFGAQPEVWIPHGRIGPNYGSVAVTRTSGTGATIPASTKVEV